MAETKKIKAEGPLQKKVMRGSEEGDHQGAVHGEPPTLRLSERVQTAEKIKRDLMKTKKSKGKS